MTNDRIILEVDLEVVKRNYLEIAKTTYPTKPMPVIKANAYGLGVIPIAEALKEVGAPMFCVADVREAMEIKHLDVPVLILGGLIPDEVPEIVANDIHAPIASLEIAHAFNKEAQKQKKTVKCHILVDTGMGRLGLHNHAYSTIIEISRMRHLDCVGIYSHFPDVYQHRKLALKQIDTMKNLISELAKLGISFEYLHIANSDGIASVEESYLAPFNKTRPGISLYGFKDENRKFDLKPAIQLKSHLVAARTLSSRSSVGYGCEHLLEKDTLVGTVAIGYADGVPFALRGNGYMIIKGKKCPIIGRISMDYTTIDLTEIPDAKIGDEVICIGGDIDVTDWARMKKTIPYDIICSFGKRIQHRYIGEIDDNS